MAIDPADLKKIDVDLVKQPVKAFDQEFAVVAGVSNPGQPPKSMTLSDLQRNTVYDTQDSTGVSSDTVDFANKNDWQVTVNQDITLTLSNLKPHEKTTLKVIKGSTDIVSFSGAPGFYEETSSQKGLTTLIFEITRNNTASEDTIVIKQLNSQSTGVLGLSDFSILPGAGTITSLGHFAWVTNKNVCTFSGEITIEASATISSIDIGITDWTVNLVYTNATVNAYITSPDTATIYATGAVTTATSSTIKFSESITAGDTVTIKWGDSFIIE